MGNCQDICQLGLTTGTQETGQNLEKYFERRRQINRVSGIKQISNDKQNIQTDQKDLKQQFTSVNSDQNNLYIDGQIDQINRKKLNNEKISYNNVTQQFIKLKTTIWNKDSHQLFDYENNDSKKCIFKIKSSGSIILAKDQQISYRKKNKKSKFSINPDSTQNWKNNQEMSLFNVQNEQGRFFLLQNFDKETTKPSSQSSWIVIKSVQNQQKKGFKLQENDFIKLGRLKFKVREICGSGQKLKKIIDEQTEFTSDQEGITEMVTLSAKNFEEGQLKSNLTNICKDSAGLLTQPNQARSSLRQKLDEKDDLQEQFSQFQILQKNEFNNQNTINKDTQIIKDNNSKDGGFTTMCKICLSEQAELNDPFVNPCKCTGSMKFVHIKCIEQWVRSKIQAQNQNQNCIVLLSKYFECELCKTKYNYKFNSQGQIYDIVEYSKPSDGSPYLILEGYMGNTSYGVYILPLTHKLHYTIGRAHDADIRVQDISVSRQHAQLTYEPETHSLFIKDRESKFGSLVLMRDDLEITPELDHIQIQNGRTLLEIIYDRDTRGILSTCFGATNENEGIQVINEEDDEPNNHEPSVDTEYIDV